MIDAVVPIPGARSPSLNGHHLEEADVQTRSLST